jgi:NADPH:quinone reductase-like Zn-dependent oxidoreductase
MPKPSIPAHPNGEMMKAVCFTAYGEGSDALSLQSIPKPFVEKKSDEVLIKVHAAALNPIDKSRLKGIINAPSRAIRYECVGI